MKPPKLPAEVRRRLEPASLLLGLAVGVAALAWAGRSVRAFDWHATFTRFHQMISPEAMYEPTVGEMCSIVRTRCRPGQVLVIVGGNSILLGVGQPTEKMWTRRLQEELGDRFAVVNLAFRGASPNDAGAIVAEVLRKEFPRQIYIADCIPFETGDPIGFETYEFALLDAYYKGLLLPWAPRDRALSAYLWARDYRDYPRMEKELGAKLDGLLYFRDLWNWVSYTYAFTFATSLAPHAPQSHWARSRFEDKEDDFDAIPFETRFSPAVVAADLNIARAYTAGAYHRAPDGSWSRDRAAYENFTRAAASQFPDPLKRRTLLLIGRNSPYYTSQLGPDIRARDELAITDTISTLKGLGYDAMDYGRDFKEEDFGDRIHLTSSGGAKLAALVAAEVRLLSARLGYDRP